MANAIPEDQWPEIDALIVVAERKLHAIKAIKALAGCSLNEAVELLYDRYAKLRREASERFDCCNRDYCRGDTGVTN